MRGLLELVLEVSNLETAVAFYRDVLRLPEVDRWPPPRTAAWLSIGRNEVLGLWPSNSGGKGIGLADSRGGSHVHFAIYVEVGSLAKWQQLIEEAGAQVDGPIEFAHGNRSLFVADPDGNVVELADWGVDWAGKTVLKGSTDESPSAPG
jgi:catechol 2,3-dioxygenase-like lactoylglutathione lyase family enzyme